MGTTEDLFVGVATHLNNASVGMYPAAAPSGAYAAGDTAIVGGGLPSAPDRAIALRIMPTVEDVIDPSGTILIAAIVRGLPNDWLDAGRLADAVKDNLLGLTHTAFGNTNVTQIQFAGSIDLDEDDQNRTRWSVKFLADVDEAPTSNRPAGGWD